MYTGSQSGDAYSFGVIIQELVLQDEPYAANQPYLEAGEIIAALREGDASLRPYLPPGKEIIYV